MTKLLHDCGEALYGPRWQSDLARDLGISDRTMRRFAAGDSEPASGVWVDLLRLTQERAMALGALADRIRIAGARETKTQTAPPE